MYPSHRARSGSQSRSLTTRQPAAVRFPPSARSLLARRPSPWPPAAGHPQNVSSSWVIFELSATSRSKTGPRGGSGRSRVSMRELSPQSHQLVRAPAGRSAHACRTRSGRARPRPRARGRHQPRSARSGTDDRGRDRAPSTGCSPVDRRGGTLRSANAAGSTAEPGHCPHDHDAPAPATSAAARAEGVGGARTTGAAARRPTDPEARGRSRPLLRWVGARGRARAGSPTFAACACRGGRRRRHDEPGRRSGR